MIKVLRGRVAELSNGNNTEIGVRTDSGLCYGLNCLGKSSALWVDVYTPIHGHVKTP